MPYNILLVDNDKPIIQMLKIRLGGEKFNINEVQDGLSAINEMRKNDFALVILDIDMPGLNGIDVLRIIKTDDKLKNLKTIILTGIIDESIKITANEIGCSAFITKPFRSSVIISKINELLNPETGQGF
ncbi:MAG TPA: response regulator [bacterium]|nr:response regulator [bacterium]HPN29324.1 response regulator [bacterium]